MYRENDPETEIFNRKGLNFFALKVFSSYYPHFGKVKNKKKNSFQKVVGSPWIDPYIFYILLNYLFNLLKFMLYLCWKCNNELDLFSINYSENISMKWRDENHILDLLLKSICLKHELLLNSNTEAVTENDIDETFDREIQSVNKELTLFLRKKSLPY
jgi:hypothetical protein